MFIYLRERGKEREEEKHQCETETLTGCSPDECAHSQCLSLSPSQRDAGLDPQQVRHVPTGRRDGTWGKGTEEGVCACVCACVYTPSSEGRERRE